MTPVLTKALNPHPGVWPEAEPGDLCGPRMQGQVGWEGLSGAGARTSPRVSVPHLEYGPHNRTYLSALL